MLKVRRAGAARELRIGHGPLIISFAGDHPPQVSVTGELLQFKAIFLLHCNEAL